MERRRKDARRQKQPSQKADPRNLRDRCCVAPSPELRARIRERLKDLSESRDISLGGQVVIGPQRRPGFNDGVIIPGTEYPLGTPLRSIRRAAAERAPLRGSVRVIVVLVDFSDEPMTAALEHFQDLFFSTGKIGTGSVREYYAEVTHGLLTLEGEVVGPYRLPRTLADYAGGQSGTENPEPNARTMARDAATLANADVDFAPYDNDGNGFVDAFIVVHSGQGAEETGGKNDIWSHKWVFVDGALDADGTKVYGYLTIPENSKIGVCAHELGHLLFGWPDLYDTDGSSEGLGDWCLMASGSWNGTGDIPAHPCAWCKADQGWVEIFNRTTNGTVIVKDVKTDRKVYRLWKNGIAGKEYFLLENRERTLYDRKLPGDGLLVYHIDETIDGNEDENHPQVKLLEADGRGHLHDGENRGDAGDSYPGSSKNVALTNTTNPGTKSYGGVDTCVRVTNIGAAGAGMKVSIAVKCVGGATAELHLPGKVRASATRSRSRVRAARTKSAVNARPKKSASAPRGGRKR